MTPPCTCGAWGAKVDHLPTCARMGFEVQEVEGWLEVPFGVRTARTERRPDPLREERRADVVRGLEQFVEVPQSGPDLPYWLGGLLARLKRWTGLVGREFVSTARDLGELVVEVATINRRLNEVEHVCPHLRAAALALHGGAPRLYSHNADADHDQLTPLELASLERGARSLEAVRRAIEASKGSRPTPTERLRQAAEKRLEREDEENRRLEDLEQRVEDLERRVAVLESRAANRNPSPLRYTCLAPLFLVALLGGGNDWNLGGELTAPGGSGTQRHHRMAGDRHVWDQGSRIWSWTEGWPPFVTSTTTSGKRDRPALTPAGWVAWNDRYNYAGQGGMNVVLSFRGNPEIVVSATNETAFDPELLDLPDGGVFVVYSEGWGMNIRAARLLPTGAIAWRDAPVAVKGTSLHHPVIARAPGGAALAWEDHSGFGYPLIDRALLRYDGSTVPRPSTGSTASYPSLAAHPRRGFLGLAWREAAPRAASARLLSPTARRLARDQVLVGVDRVLAAWDGDELELAVLDGATVRVFGHSFPAEALGSFEIHDDQAVVAYDRAGRARWRRLIR